MLNLDFEDNDFSRNNVIKRFKERKKPIVIYGAGRFAVAVAGMLEENGIRVMCFIEDEKWWHEGKTISVGTRNYNAYSLRCFRSLYNAKEYNICSGIIDYRVMNELKEEFSECEIVEYLDAIDFHIMDHVFLDTNRGLLEEIYESMEDDLSKQVMESYLYSRYSGDVSRISKMVRNQGLYDWELIRINKNDVIIDGGAYTGDSILEMNKILNGMPQRIYAFEPDENNTKELIRQRFKNVEVIRAGLLDHDGMVGITESDGMRTSLKESGTGTVKVISINNHPEFWDATVVKMDIEGSEVSALLGMTELLRKKPRLAICIYHKNEDIINVYKLLKSYGYRFFLRQHSYSNEETVMYAI